MYRIGYLSIPNSFFCSFMPKGGPEKLLTEDGRWIYGSFITHDYYSGPYYDVIRNMRKHCGRVRFRDSDMTKIARQEAK